MTTSLHAHFDTASRDCDGLYTHDWIEPIREDEDDLDFHNRIVSLVVNTYSLMENAELKVERVAGDVRMTWTEPTEEGFRSTEATFCTDDCELVSHFRDHTAEAAGY